MSRQLQLPGDVDIAKVSATLEKGVLKVFLPKLHIRRANRRPVPITSKL